MIKISLDELDEMVDYINELTKIYERNEKSECVFNPLIFLKILSLPFYDDKYIKEKEEIIKKILSNTPCQDRLEIYREQFIVFYKEWLKKHHPDVIDKLSKIELFKVDDFIEVDREKSIQETQKDKIDAKTFLSNADIDEKMIYNLLTSINKMMEISKEYEEINYEFLEKLFTKNEFINFFLYSIEFRDLSYALELLKLKLLSFDYDKLPKSQKTLLKKILDSILEDLNNWVYKVLVEKSAIDIHYLDDSLLANIEQIDLILESLKNNGAKNEIEMF